MVAEPGTLELEKELDSDGLLGSDPSSILTVGGLWNSSGPQFLHL